MKLKNVLITLIFAVTLSACNIVYDTPETLTETQTETQTETSADTSVETTAATSPETTAPTDTTIASVIVQAITAGVSNDSSSNDGSSENTPENIPPETTTAASTTASTTVSTTTASITTTAITTTETTTTLSETTTTPPETTTAPPETTFEETTTMPINGRVDDVFVFSGGILGGGLFDGVLENGKPVGQGTFTSPEISYTGAFKNGLPEGAGKLEYASGTKYEGNFKNGDYSGQGTLSHYNGDVYTGGFKNGEYDGFGVYKNADGYTYEGSWVNGEKHGSGTGYSYADASDEEARPGKNYITNFNYENGLIVAGTYQMITYRNDGSVATEYRQTAPSRDHFLGEWAEDPVTTRRIVVTYPDGSKDEWLSDITAGAYSQYYGRIHTDAYGVVTVY
jgi:hypothetical protein